MQGRRLFQCGKQQVYGFNRQMIMAAGLCIKRFQHIDGTVHGAGRAFHAKAVATAVDRHAQMLLDEFDVLVELPAKLAQASGIVGFQRELAA